MWVPAIGQLVAGLTLVSEKKTNQVRYLSLGFPVKLVSSRSRGIRV